MKFSVNKTLIYLLIFTTVASAIAFHMVVKGYDVTYEIYADSLNS